MGNPISNDYNNVNLLQFRQRYIKPVETQTYQPTEEIGGGGVDYTPVQKSNNGLSQLVANAFRNDDGSYDIRQYVDSGYGRRGMTEKTYIA